MYFWMRRGTNARPMAQDEPSREPGGVAGKRGSGRDRSKRPRPWPGTYAPTGPEGPGGRSGRPRPMIGHRGTPENSEQPGQDRIASMICQSRISRLRDSLPESVSMVASLSRGRTHHHWPASPQRELGLLRNIAKRMIPQGSGSHPSFGNGLLPGRSGTDDEEAQEDEGIDRRGRAPPRALRRRRSGVGGRSRRRNEGS